MKAIVFDEETIRRRVEELGREITAAYPNGELLVLAEALLRQAVQKDPNYAPSWSLLAAAIFFNGRIAIVDAKAKDDCA